MDVTLQCLLHQDTNQSSYAPLQDKFHREGSTLPILPNLGRKSQESEEMVQLHQEGLHGVWFPGTDWAGNSGGDRHHRHV